MAGDSGVAVDIVGAGASAGLKAPVPVNGLNPEKRRDLRSRRGSRRYRWGPGLGAAGSIGPLRWRAAVASMLVLVSIPMRVVDECCPRVHRAPGTGDDQFGV